MFFWRKNVKTFKCNDKILWLTMKIFIKCKMICLKMKRELFMKHKYRSWISTLSNLCLFWIFLLWIKKLTAFWKPDLLGTRSLCNHSCTVSFSSCCCNFLKLKATQTEDIPKLWSSCGFWGERSFGTGVASAVCVVTAVPLQINPCHI